MAIVRINLIVLTLLILAGQATAEVQSASQHGFVILHQREIGASQANVYQAASAIQNWWDASHSYSGDSANLSLQLRPGGAFLEKLADGGFVEHLRVTTVMPERMIRLAGGLGPLAADGVAGEMTWEFASVGKAGKSKLVWRYSVSGARTGGFEELATAVDAVLGIQFDRLVSFAERGDDSSNEKTLADSPKGLKAVTEHTYTQAGGFVTPTATVDQFSFIVGRWTGHAMGGWCEEVWSPPAGGEMQGMFQFVQEDKVQFRELFALRKTEDDNWQLCLKHFGAAMKGWEEKDEMVTFELLSVEPNRAVFDGLTMQRDQAGKLMVYVRSQDSQGKIEELVFEYEKAGH